MRAALLTKIPAETLELRIVDEPIPGPSEVIISVFACGICGTDLHIIDGDSYQPQLPFVLGHEPVGTVISVGPDVDEAWVGRRVVPTLFLGCGICRACRAGEERLCEKGALATGVIGPWGGFADRMKLHVNQLLSVPESMSNITAAGLVDAGITAQNAVRILTERVHYDDDERYLVIGAGPVGVYTAEFLRIAGYDFVIVESNLVRQAAAAERGYAVVSTLSELSGTFSAAIDCAGAADLVPDLLQILRSHGIYLSVGYTRLPEFDLSILARKELEIRGVRSGARIDLEKVLSLVASGSIAPPSSKTWKLDEINEALRSLQEGGVQGKAVILMEP